MKNENTKNPIILNENGDISLYANLDEAISNLEPIDIYNNEYEIYDSEGSLLKLGLEGELYKPFLFKSLKIPKNIILQTEESNEENKEKLKLLLVNFIENTSDTPINWQDKTLGELVDQLKSQLLQA